LFEIEKQVSKFPKKKRQRCRRCLLAWWM